MNQALLVSNVLLWVVVLAMAVVIFALVRQIGVLYERVAPAGALMLNRKLSVGMDAPRISVPTLSGGQFEVGAPSAEGRSRLLFFVAPDCPLCKSMLPALLSAARAERDWLDLVFASDGDTTEHAAFVRSHGLDGYPYLLSEILGRSYGVSKLPYGVLIDETGHIASLGIVNSREHLDSLFEAKERKVASIQEYVGRSGT
ncbi:MAG: redoxin domain-containing protein [Gammaproteobacteria bacterium]